MRKKEYSHSNRDEKKREYAYSNRDGKQGRVSESYRQMVFRRFRHHHLAVIGLFVMAILVGAV